MSDVAFRCLLWRLIGLIRYRFRIEYTRWLDISRCLCHLCRRRYFLRLSLRLLCLFQLGLGLGCGDDVKVIDTPPPQPLPNQPSEALNTSKG